MNIHRILIQWSEKSMIAADFGDEQDFIILKSISLSSLFFVNCYPFGSIKQYFNVIICYH